MNNLYVYLSILALAIYVAFRLTRHFRIIKRKKPVQAKQLELINFLKKFRSELYSKEYALVLDQFDGMKKNLDDSVKNFKMKEMPAMKKLRDEQYRAAKETITFDPFGLLSLNAKQNLDFLLEMKEKGLQVEVEIIHARIRVAYSEIMLGGLTPEAKLRLDLSEKCLAYLKEEMHFKNYVEAKKSRKLLDETTARINYFLKAMKMPILSQHYLAESK